MKLREILSQIGIDKYMHFAMAAIAAFALRVALLIAVPYGWAAMVSFIIVIALCVAKERLYDYRMGKGTPEWADLAAGALGAFLGAF